MTDRKPVVRVDGRYRQMRSDEKIPAENLPNTSKNMDGGFAASVYLAEQEVDGGGANG